jgi:predicted DNA-binding transcriptional regulator AlpA
MNNNPFSVLEEKLDAIQRMLLDLKNEQMINSQKEPRGLPVTGGIDLAVSITGLKKSTIYKMSATGVIPFSKPSGKLIFIAKDLLEWIQNSNQQNQNT